MLTNYEEFKIKILKLTGIDLSSYKERQMKRRIDSLIHKNNYDDYDMYFKALTQNSKLYDEFINYLTINVSEFYRNPLQWEILEKEIMPEIMKLSSRPKIWSAACSTGEEPFSIAMMMSRFVDLSNLKILATDIDDGAISKAKNGIYDSKSLENLPKDFIDNYFTKAGEKYKISDKIMNCIEFNHHNLLVDKYPERCDLIVCRNVMIYFTEEAKTLMYHNFRESLDSNGILFVGSTEQIIFPLRYKLEPVKSFFYRRNGQA
ncbi:MAG: protein-glutamate O-methyltransferase CheR [Clostridiaceae bacterium]|nr:protein-glutamate O-methyltransferase CheR [Clostridiaceae bacterium]